MLEVNNVQKNFGPKIAVNDLSFTIKPGETLGLLGTNGAGKTTTFRMILGIFSPDSGSINLDGHPISLDDSPRIGFLPEERSLLQKYTIDEQLCFFGELKGKTRAELAPEIEHWLEYFELTEHRFSKIKELSKGNQQKIQFISSVLHSPDLLILDEPFSGLDPLNIKLIAEAIKQLSKRGTMIIFSSHRLDYVEAFSNDVIVLQKGVPVLEGNINSIKQEANEYVVEIQTEDVIENLETLPFVVSVDHLNDIYKVKIAGYENVDNIFKHVSSYKIRKFDVNLPNLEELVVKAVKESHE
ncbi:ATP-binding cassette domain-containing protein [Mollicutes bacterium LVI A0039]|nr:ATP-binding cassette domain-containing protein [Mollicutes bacterium LVI A0039]